MPLVVAIITGLAIFVVMMIALSIAFEGLRKVSQSVLRGTTTATHYLRTTGKAATKHSARMNVVLQRLISYDNRPNG